MKYLIILFFPFFLNAQMDTIFRRNGDILLGTIGTVTEYDIFFKNNKGIKDNIKLSKVVKYVITKKIPKPQPSLSSDSLVTPTLTNYSRDEDIQYMKDCFRRCHKSYTEGMLVSIVGFIATAGGVYLNTSSVLTNNESDLSKYLIIGGAVSSLLGTIIILDSHKWIGRAGMNLNGVGLCIKKK